SARRGVHQRAAGVVIILACLSSVGANAEVFGIRCVSASSNTDYRIDTSAGTVSWNANGQTWSSPAQVTPSSIDWTDNNSDMFSETNHIDRATGDMQSVTHSNSGDKPDGHYSYRCTKIGGI
ncbi:MAG TPA: hypothetical protein VKB71_00215, partial [Rhizomicrobium sp.]|nr:hypothetical protein [Rhizomicrobium sp.]